MNWWTKAYMVMGSSVCVWFAAACLFGWRAPNLGFVDSASHSSGGGGGVFYGGRSSGGSWGGGK